MQADDAGVDTAVDAAQGDDASTDGPTPIFVEAGVRRDASPPQPCLTMKKPPDPDDEHDGCAQSPGPLAGPGGSLVVAGLALTALRRRKKTGRDDG